MSNTDPQHPVLLAPEVVDAFSGVNIELTIAGRTFPAVLSATSHAVTFTVSVLNQTQNAPRVVELTFPWVDVLMHSTIDTNSMFVVLTAPKYKLPIAWMNRQCPGLDLGHDEDRNGGCGDGGEEQEEEDDCFVREIDNSEELAFTILSQPTTAFPLVFNDTMQMLALADDENSNDMNQHGQDDRSNEMDDENNTAAASVLTPEQQDRFLTQILSDKTQHVYHLFSQCIRLNPDNLADGGADDDMAGFQHMMGLLDAMELPDGMLTAEDFLSDEEGGGGEGEDGGMELDEMMALYGAGFVEKDEENEQRFENNKRKQPQQQQQQEHENITVTDDGDSSKME